MTLYDYVTVFTCGGVRISGIVTKLTKSYVEIDGKRIYRDNVIGYTVYQ